MYAARLTHTDVCRTSSGGMQRITISLPDDLHERFIKLADEGGPYDSKSEAVRGLIHDLEADIQEYESELRDAYDQLRQCEGRLQEYDDELTSTREEYESEIEGLKTQYEEEIESLKAEHESEMDNMKAQYEERIENLETENERLHRQLAATNKRVDQHQELVRTVERQQSLAERKARAGLLTKTKWVLFGMSDDPDE